MGMVVLMLLLGLEEEPAPDAGAEISADAPAGGSVNGPWAFALVGPSLGGATLQGRPDVAGLLDVSAGWGFGVAGRRLVPTLHFFGAASFTDRVVHAAAMPLDVALAAPDLYEEPLTQLRISALVGLTIPTAAIMGGMPYTTPVA